MDFVNTGLPNIYNTIEDNEKITTDNNILLHKLDHVKYRSEPPHMGPNMNPITNLKPIHADLQQRENSVVEMDTEMHKLMLQSIPPAKDWPKLSGGNEEIFYDFIDYIDGIMTSINPPSQIITFRFSTVFTGVAFYWYNELLEKHGQQSWDFWKTEMIKQFKTPAWVTKITMKFEQSKI